MVESFVDSGNLVAPERETLRKLDPVFALELSRDRVVDDHLALALTQLRFHHVGSDGVNHKLFDGDVVAQLQFFA